jgi:hypothetical protein
VRSLTSSAPCNRPIVLALKVEAPGHVGLCLARPESGRSALGSEQGEWLNDNGISG